MEPAKYTIGTKARGKAGPGAVPPRAQGPRPPGAGGPNIPWAQAPAQGFLGHPGGPRRSRAPGHPGPQEGPKGGWSPAAPGGPRRSRGEGLREKDPGPPEGSRKAPRCLEIRGLLLRAPEEPQGLPCPGPAVPGPPGTSALWVCGSGGPGYHFPHNSGGPPGPLVPRSSGEPPEVPRRGLEGKGPEAP